MNTVKTYLLEDHSRDHCRSGEGAAVELGDGSLFLGYSHFEGGSDASPAVLVSRRSVDGGIRWGARTRLVEPGPSWVNVMSVSLLRLQDGRIGGLFLGKIDKETCQPFWMISEDEAATWSAPRRLIRNAGYYVVNNDRLVQLADGRLLVPYSHTPSRAQRHRSCSGCLISDDGGRNWRHGEDEIRILPENYRIPDSVVPDRLPALRPFCSGSILTQEPGVVELDDGQVLMWVRSNGGFAYASRSADRGETWSPFEPLCDIPMPIGPATIQRVPGTSRLVMIHNDRTGVPYGDPTFHWRTPLAVAVSDDEGRTWQRHEPLIGDQSRNFCYHSLCWFGERSLVTTYESADVSYGGAPPVRENLRSLRLLRVDRDWWMR